jgi:hypothetical protein
MKFTQIEQIKATRVKAKVNISTKFSSGIHPEKVLIKKVI